MPPFSTSYPLLMPNPIFAPSHGGQLTVVGPEKHKSCPYGCVTSVFGSFLKQLEAQRQGWASPAPVHLSVIFSMRKLPPLTKSSQHLHIIKPDVSRLMVMGFNIHSGNSSNTD